MSHDEKCLTSLKLSTFFHHLPKVSLAFHICFNLTLFSLLFLIFRFLLPTFTHFSNCCSILLHDTYIHGYQSSKCAIRVLKWIMRLLVLWWVTWAEQMNFPSCFPNILELIQSQQRKQRENKSLYLIPIFIFLLLLLLAQGMCWVAARIISHQATGISGIVCD